MPIPKTVFRPAFNVTRASHIVLKVRDIEASRAFYVDTLGFVVSGEANKRLYLRGLEEACHHSLVLVENDVAYVERLGFRVLTDEDLDLAEEHFRKTGLSPTWADTPHQGRTLLVADVAGVPLEICVTMETRPRLILQSSSFHGACPQRLDHFQIIAPLVQKALEFYMRMGFRLSEYVTPDGSEEPAFVFLQRKGNPHDIVFGQGPGPRLHHVAFVVPESHHLMFICDLLAEKGYASSIEFGPGRHFAPGYARFLYLRDPDGHRIELFNTHYQTMDSEDAPIRWEMSKAFVNGWGSSPPESWLTQGAPFGANST